MCSSDLVSLSVCKSQSSLHRGRSLDLGCVSICPSNCANVSILSSSRTVLRRVTMLTTTSQYKSQSSLHRGRSLDCQPSRSLSSQELAPQDREPSLIGASPSATAGQLSPASNCLPTSYRHREPTRIIVVGVVYTRMSSRPSATATPRPKIIPSEEQRLHRR